MAQYLTYLTLDTGHTSRAFRSDIPEAVMDIMGRLVERALAGERPAMEHDPALSLSMAAERRSAMIATLWLDVDGRPAPVVTFAVARTSRASAGVWSVIDNREGTTAKLPPAPWLCVRFEVGLSVAPQTILSELASLEQAVAWAWLERRGLQ